MELYFQIAELVALAGFVWWFRGWNVEVDITLQRLCSRVEVLEALEQERTNDDNSGSNDD